MLSRQRPKAQAASRKTGKAPRSHSGQNTAEYILMLVLVAGAALGAFKVFGKTIIERFNVVIANMQGDTATVTKHSQEMHDADWDIQKANTVGSSNGGGAGGGGGTPTGGG